MSQTQSFCKILNETLAFITTKFPSDKDLEYSKSQIELALLVSQRLTITTFVNATTPFLAKIEARDSDFFLNVANAEPALACLKLGDKWGNLSPADQEYLWQNVKRLTVLGQKLIS